MARRSRTVPRRAARASAIDGAALDARYGLEPVIEPGPGGAELSDFARVDCPYCGEQYEATLDLSAGSFSYVEDCQICCQPIELSGTIDAAGTLRRFSARRLD